MLLLSRKHIIINKGLLIRLDDDLDDIITYMGWEDIKYIFVNGFIMHINYIKIYKLSILDFICDLL